MEELHGTHVDGAAVIDDAIEVDGFRKHPDDAPLYRISVTTKDDGQIMLIMRSGKQVVETYSANTVSLLKVMVNSQSTTIMIDDALATKISDSLKIEAITKRVASQRASIRVEFAEIVERARPKYGEQVNPASVEAAARKLSVFEKHIGAKRTVTGEDGATHTGYDNQEMAMKLATMNRAGRQAYFSDLRTERGALKRAAARKKVRNARKARRRG
jgi:flagellar hook-associated protein FlgK